MGGLLQECLVNAGVSQGPILGPGLFLLYINIFPNVICNTVADATLYSKLDEASNF